MDIIRAPEEQGLFQALDQRRLRIVRGERYMRAPDTIRRAMAYAVSFVDRPENLAAEYAWAIDLE